MVDSWIFDLDGTLIDSFPGIAECARRALAKVCPDRRTVDFRAFVGPPIRRIFSNALNETDPLRLDALEAAFRTYYDGGGWKATMLYPGVRETLEELTGRGTACYIVTNKPSHATHLILEWLGIGAYFREAVSPDVRTPAFASKVEAALDLACRRGLQPNRTVVVGDSPDDAEMAQSGGFSFVAAEYGYGRITAESSIIAAARILEFSELVRFNL